MISFWSFKPDTKRKSTRTTNSLNLNKNKSNNTIKTPFIFWKEAHLTSKNRNKTFTSNKLEYSLQIFPTVLWHPL